MAQTTEQYLNSLLSTWTPPPGYFEAHRKHRVGIETRLDIWWGLHEMFETGSLRHGTGVRQYSDADYFASMKGERPSADTALARVKAALQDRYRDTTVQIRKPTVKCLFANGTQTVEVAPAFAADDGGYWIPDPKQGGWMKCHPKNHNAYVNEANKKHGGAAKKLTRLVKLWKYRRSVPISSCYLEMRAAKYAVDTSCWIVYMDIYYFLKGLRDRELAAVNDPTGLGSRFNACSSDWDRSVALSKLDTAVRYAEAAMVYALDDKHALAIDRYKLLFNMPTLA